MWKFHKKRMKFLTNFQLVARGVYFPKVFHTFSSRANARFATRRQKSQLVATFRDSGVSGFTHVRAAHSQNTDIGWKAAVWFRPHTMPKELCREVPPDVRLSLSYQ